MTFNDYITWNYIRLSWHVRRQFQSKVEDGRSGKAWDGKMSSFTKSFCRNIAILDHAFFPPNLNRKATIHTLMFKLYSRCHLSILELLPLDMLEIKRVKNNNNKTFIWTTHLVATTNLQCGSEIYLCFVLFYHFNHNI